MAADNMSDTSAKSGSDLPTRLVSAVAMLAVTVGALWLGGWAWIVFVLAVAGLTIWEWNKLVGKFELSPFREIVWLFFGAVYVGLAALALIFLGDDTTERAWWFVLVGFLLPIFAVDVGAYFAGRAIGGPKIAPRISPSKTWAGFIGGALAAAIVLMGVEYFVADAELVTYDQVGEFGLQTVGAALLLGTIIAAIAQAGDFFQSWMKRRAGVKDSSNLIPGHGGIFDRVDGLIAVCFVVSLMYIAGSLLS